MTGERDFSEADWKQICRGPATAGLYVSYASKGGTIKETKAIADAYTRARKGEAVGQLLQEVVRTFPVIGGHHSDRATDIKERLIADLRESWALVERHAERGEAAEYREFLLDIAQAVAAASKGIDLDEAQAVAEVESALRLAR